MLFSFFTTTALAQQNTQDIQWLYQLDDRGIGYIQYTGSDISSRDFLDLIQNTGCTLRVLWIPEQRIGYHKDAIEAGVDTLINKPFYDSTIQKDTKITLQCTDYTEQTPSFNLTETHIHWITDPQPDIQRNKQGQATIQYGGGSFYQLVSRLSTQGCNVHTLSINGVHYSFENTNEQNQEFTNNYKQHIPKDTNITITCVDNCDIIYGLDLVEDPNFSHLIQNIEWCDDNTEIVYAFEPNAIELSPCSNDWLQHSRVFFDIVPVFQDVCKVVVTVSEQDILGAAAPGVYIQQKAMYQIFIPFIYVTQHQDPAQQEKDIDVIQTELHELCHVHQNWYTFKEYIDYNYLENTSHDGQISFLWYETPMAQEFNDIVGFTQRADGEWNPLFGSIYYNSFPDGHYVASDPKELSADLCANYLLQKIQPNNNEYSQYAQSPYITPEIEQWIQKYILLPE